MNHYALSFFFSLSFLFFACEESNHSDAKKVIEKVEKANVKVKDAIDSKNEENPKKIIQEEQVQNFKGNLAEPKATLNTKVPTPIKQKPVVNKSKTTQTEKKEVIPARWKYVYSKDKKWMDLYESSRTYFLNGWNTEFERNSDAQISKDELLLAYRKRMENIFYETPSFIEFCVQEMKVSTEFEDFCQKWNEQVR